MSIQSSHNQEVGGPGKRARECRSLRELADLFRIEGSPFSAEIGEETSRQSPSVDPLVEKLIGDLVEIEEFAGLTAHHFPEKFGPPFLEENVELAKTYGDLLAEGLTCSSGDVNKSQARRYQTKAVELLNSIAPHAMVELNSSNGTIELDGKSLTNFPVLFERCGFKGGVARKGLALLLGVNIETAAVRDIDCVAIGEHPSAKLAEVSRRFMFDDWVVNSKQGVERINSYAHDLPRRDFTVNEVFLIDKKVIMTPQCVFDTVGSIIRPCAQYRLGGVSSISAVKALRFFVELKKDYRNPQLRGIRLKSRNAVKAEHIALHLDRSLEKGVDLANAFLSEVNKAGYLNNALAGMSARAAIRHLASRIPQGLNLFKNLGVVGISK